MLSNRNQTAMKTRLNGAQKGHSLLKKKLDALNQRFRGIVKQLVQVGRTIHILCESKKSPGDLTFFSFFSQTDENLKSIFYTPIKRSYLR